MKKIGVFPLFEKPEAVNVAVKLMDLLQDAGFKVVMGQDRLGATGMGQEEAELFASLDYPAVACAPDLSAGDTYFWD